MLTSSKWEQLIPIITSSCDDQNHNDMKVCFCILHDIPILYILCIVPSSPERYFSSQQNSQSQTQTMHSLRLSSLHVGHVDGQNIF